MTLIADLAAHYANQSTDETAAAVETVEEAPQQQAEQPQRQQQILPQQQPQQLQPEEIPLPVTPGIVAQRALSPRCRGNFRLDHINGSPVSHLAAGSSMTGSGRKRWADSPKIKTILGGKPCPATTSPAKQAVSCEMRIEARRA